jgi:hypothetical protein
MNSLAEAGVGNSDWQIFRRKSVRNYRPRGKRRCRTRLSSPPTTRCLEAHTQLRDAMHTAMLKADPSIQPILDKIPAGDRRGR